MRVKPIRADWTRRVVITTANAAGITVTDRKRRFGVTRRKGRASHQHLLAPLQIARQPEPLAQLRSAEGSLDTALIWIAMVTESAANSSTSHTRRYATQP